LAALPTQLSAECRVLVVNSSREMAKEMTVELTMQIPGCAITYAPTIELAKLILARRRIDLVVASPMLPDGSITKLKDSLERFTSPPDVVVVGNLSMRNAELLGGSRYEFAALRRMHNEPSAARAAPKIVRRSAIERQGSPVSSISNAGVGSAGSVMIRDLGANIRNDLNNPLQEIVAMVFVAQEDSKTEGTASPATMQALQAIERTAKSMAMIVNGLEEKIKIAVVGG